MSERIITYSGGLADGTVVQDASDDINIRCCWFVIGDDFSERLWYVRSVDPSVFVYLPVPPWLP